jgi:hypothetical protein
MAVFCVVAPCSLVEIIRAKMEAVRSSETSVNFYQTTRRYNPEDSHLSTNSRDNLKSYSVANTPLWLVVLQQAAKNGGI